MTIVVNVSKPRAFPVLGLRRICVADALMQNTARSVEELAGSKASSLPAAEMFPAAESAAAIAPYRDRFRSDAMPAVERGC